MNKKLIIYNIFTAMIILCTSVYAAVNANLKLSLSTNNLKAGDEFEVILSLKDLEEIDGIDSIEGYINVNENVVEPISFDSIVKDKAGNVLGNDVVLTTGMKLVVDDDEYTIVVKGDVNGDGIVDSKDSASIKGYRLDTERLDGAALEAADINKDGKVNRIDSFLILYYRAEKIENFSDEVINAIMR